MSAGAAPVRRPSVAVVGGGLAGLAAAVAATRSGLRVELFERHRHLGGRVSSFRDGRVGRMVDDSQHVSMGCCTNLADFCRRTGIAGCFRCDRTSHFFGPDGARYDFAASGWLPVPLHLAPASMRLGYLTLGERWAVGRTMLRLARLPADSPETRQTMGDWLRRQGQSPRAIDLFWSVVVVGALSETVDRVSVGVARKVFADGFLAARRACEIEVPTLPLAVLMDRVADHLARHDVVVHRRSPTTRVETAAGRANALVLRNGDRREFDYYVVAVPWARVGSLFSAASLAGLPGLAGAEQIVPAAIMAVHLWFDRPIASLPHAALVGRLAQWVFFGGPQDASGVLAPGPSPPAPHPASGARGEDVSTGSIRGMSTIRDMSTAAEASALSERGHYCQVVISAAHDLADRSRQDVLDEVRRDIESVWPNAREARLLHWRLVRRPAAVFSCRPGLDELRPAQQTPLANLMLAGDWTATGWPATMEGAVRSGYLAVEAILRSLGRPERLLVPDLPRSWLARRLLGES